MRNKERITLNMNTMQIVMAMTDGNPGAMQVVMRMLTEGAKIDPDSALEGLGPILSLDTYGIYGEKIWMIYKDICGQSLADTICLLRGVQLGIIDRSELKTALQQPYAKLADGRLEEVLAAVRERLPLFAKY